MLRAFGEDNPAYVHGRTRSRVYQVWKNMKQRCFNKRNPQYKDYGARGISVHKRWLSFATFVSDVGEPPSGYTLERINNDRGYEPKNVKWAPPMEQQNNRRSNVTLRHPITGCRRTLAQWARFYGVKAHAFGKFYRRRKNMGDKVLLEVEKSTALMRM